MNTPDPTLTDDECDLGMCPYLARYEGLAELPTYDPDGVCFQMGVCSSVGEPQCVTCSPKGGWPSVHRMLADAYRPDASGVSR